MKTSLFFFFFIFFVFNSQAQYKVDFNTAPVNETPIKYTREHFNLKGPVKTFKNTYYIYTFNNQGYLLSDYNTLGNIDRKYIYDTQSRPVRIESDAFGMVIPYTITYDSQNRISENKTTSNVGSIYKYNKDGLLSEEYDFYKNELKRRYTYDKKGRVVKDEGFYPSIKETSENNFTYNQIGDFLEVTQAYSSSNPEHQNSTSKIFYKNGNYYGKNQNSKIEFDTYGNPLHYINMEGTKGGALTYTYFDGSSNDDGSSSTPNIPMQIETKPTSGCVYGDCLNGWGNYVYDNGYYDGFWENGKKSGYGLYNWTNAGKYYGEWTDDKMTGYGVYEEVNKDHFTGEFINGQLNGFGVSKKGETWQYGIFSNGQISTAYTFYDNKIETGCIAGDCQNKYGRFKWSNGDTFTGFFKNGKIYLGVYLFANDDLYQGKFNTSNQFSGMGRYFFKNGNYYGGMWQNGKYHGKGYFEGATAADDKMGDWNNGVLVKPM